MVVDIEEGPGGMPKLACSMRAVDQESGQPLMSLAEAAQRRVSPLAARLPSEASVPCRSTCKTLRPAPILPLLRC